MKHAFSLRLVASVGAWLGVAADSLTQEPAGIQWDSPVLRAADPDSDEAPVDAVGNFDADIDGSGLGQHHGHHHRHGHHRHHHDVRKHFRGSVHQDEDQNAAIKGPDDKQSIITGLAGARSELKKAAVMLKTAGAGPQRVRHHGHHRELPWAAIATRATNDSSNVTVAPTAAGNDTDLDSSDMVTKLLEGYRPEEPRQHGGPAGIKEIAVGFQANKLLDLNPKERTMTMTGWIRQYWFDPRLVYDGKDVDKAWDDKADFLQVGRENIWYPDVEVRNTVDYNWDELCEDVDVFIYDASAGASVDIGGGKRMAYNVLYSRPCTVKTKCPISFASFPFETNVCPLVFMPWGDKFLSLHVAVEALEIGLSNAEFKVGFKNASQETNVYAASGGGRWESVTINFYVARHARSYVVGLIVPVLLIVMLSWVALWIPMGASDQISFLATLVLTIVAINFVNADKVPASDVETWLDRFQTLTLFLVVIVTLYSVLLHRFHPPETWAEEQRDARMQRVLKVERLARIIYPTVAVISLGVVFGQIAQQELNESPMEQETTDSGTVSIAALAAIAVMSCGLCCHACAGRDVSAVMHDKL